MNGLTPGLLDRLLGAGDARPGASWTLEQYKDSVARDLEDLLNTRCALAPELLSDYPECASSILNYGLRDFAGLCMSSSTDRARICAALSEAVERHEPRLRKVRAQLDYRQGTINCISFVISAELAAPALNAAVSFDAVLQPSSLHYAIQRSSHHHSARGAQP